MLDSNYNIKIIDFGDARKIDEPIEDENDDEMGARPSFTMTTHYKEQVYFPLYKMDTTR